MKRAILSVAGTIFGLVALLSFKSNGNAAIGTSLPAAGLAPASTSGAASAPPTTSQPTASAAPPAPATPTTPAAPAAPTTSAASPSGTFNGTAVRTRYGTVQVAATIDAGKITNVAFLQLTSHDSRSADINSQAGPYLLRETLSAQSSNIDTISGATYTSEGYIQSLQSALNQAGLK